LETIHTTSSLRGTKQSPDKQSNLHSGLSYVEIASYLAMTMGILKPKSEEVSSLFGFII
jgi:hypothetical protein